MNDNQKRINSFLHFLRDIIKENPNFEISRNNIYDWVTKLDVSPEEYDEDLISYGWFDEWKKMYPEQNRTSNNAGVYFCRFANKEKDFIDVSNPIKMYIPIDIKHVKLSFEKIMNFLNENNIAYYTKIGREIRVDNIVIRVTNENDAKIITEFINNDEYIKEGLGKSSPFCFNYNGVALTLDGHMSYHNTLVNHIYNYIEDKKNNDELDTIDYQSFIEYMEKLYSNRYENFSEFSNIELADYNIKTSCERNILIDKEINKLIISVNRDDFDDKDFFKLFDDYNDKEKINSDKDDFCVLRLMSSIIKIHGDKYGIDNALNATKLYIETNKLDYITSRAMLREELVNNDFLTKLRVFLSKYNTTLDELFVLLAKEELKVVKLENKNNEEINKLKLNLDKKLKNIIDDLASFEIEEIKKDNSNINNTQLIQNALLTTMKRLKFFFITLEPKSITRKNNLRQKCINARPDILTIIYNTGIKLDDYLNNVIQDSLLLKESILDDAIYTTYSKYQNYYENGTIEYDGISFVKYALDILLMENNYAGFTSSDNVRNNLLLVSNEDLIKILAKKTGNSNIKTMLHFDEKRINLIEEYINSVINDYEKENKKESITL